MFCPMCGNEVTDNAKFCSECGYDLEKKKISKENNSTAILLIILVFCVIPVFACFLYSKRNDSVEQDSFESTNNGWSTSSQSNKSSLYGYWGKQQYTSYQLAIYEEGGFEYEATGGVYEIQGDELILHTLSGLLGKYDTTYKYEISGDNLTLTDVDSGEVLYYERKSGHEEEEIKTYEQEVIIVD